MLSAPESPWRAPPSLSHRVAGRPVMVVDDDRDIRETLQECLEIEGYDVVTASNGKEALERARAARPALILLDLFMPVMDGVEFRQRQMKDPDIGSIPVVVVSAASGLADRVRPLHVDGHLEKPLALDRLFEVVERYVQR